MTDEQLIAFVRAWETLKDAEQIIREFLTGLREEHDLYHFRDDLADALEVITPAISDSAGMPVEELVSEAYARAHERLMAEIKESQQ